MEEKYYYCSKYIRFPIKNVVQKIYDLYNTTNKSFINISDIYEYLREQFNAKSFNRANLIELLGSSGDVSFNTVKDLYVKYVVETNKEESVNYDILNKVFIQNRIRVIEFINALGLDSLKDMLSNGFSRWLILLNQFLDKNEETNIKTKNSSLLYMFVEGYEENELLTILQDEEAITNKIESFIEITQRKTKCQQLKNNINFRLEDVHKDNLSLLVKYLFAGSVSQILSAHNIKTIQELNDLEANVLEELLNHETNIINKLKSLQFSLKEKLNEDFKLLIQLANKQNKPNKLWENYVSILENRAKGKTLEASGEHLELTRERVRQLESKYFELFNKFNQKLNYPISILRAMVEDDLFVQDADIIKIFSFNPLLFKFFLLNSNNDNLEYAEELGKFYYVDDYRWYDEAVRYAENLPEQLDEADVNNYSDELVNILLANETVISIEDCRKIILSLYKKSGDIYSKNKMNLAEKYKFIWKEYFPEVINIYDDEFLTKFKKVYSKTFGDNKEYSDRSIAGILTRIGILCGRGEYKIKPKTLISDELLKEICDYIDSSEKEIFITNTIFNLFEDKLRSEGINNKYYMQGVLHASLPNKYFFKRDYVSKSKEATSLYAEITKFVCQSDSPVTKAQLREEFPGVTDVVISFAMQDENIICGFSVYMSKDFIEKQSEYVDTLRNVISEMVEDGEIHKSEDLMSILSLMHPDIIEAFEIESRYTLFSIVEALFKDEFSLSRPFFALKGVEIGKQEERMRDYLEGKDEVDIDEFMEFVRDNSFVVWNILTQLNAFNDIYLLKNKNTLITIDSTGLNRYKAEYVEEYIDEIIKGNEVLVLNNLNYSLLPKINIQWNDWLVYSVINKWSNKYKVMMSSSQFRYSVPIIYRLEEEPKDLEELLNIIKNKRGFDDTQMAIYMKERNLVF